MAKTPTRTRLQAPPPSVEAAPGNLKEPRTYKDLNFKVDEDFHFQFKSIALQQRKSMVDLLQEMFAEYKQRHQID